MIEDLLVQRENTIREIEENGDKDGRLVDRLNKVNEALGFDPEGRDELADRWEKQLESGETPDLDER